MLPPSLRFSLTAFSFASLLVLPGLASAREPASAAAGPPSAPNAESAEKSDASDSGAHLQSLELMVRPTIGGAGSGSPVHTTANAPVSGTLPKVLGGTASPYGATFGIGAELGFRFHPIISAGLRGDYSTVSADTVNDGTTQLSRSRQSAGFYTRVYPLALNESIRAKLDPWVATGVQYMHDAQNFHSPTATSNGGTVDATYKIDHHAVGIPLAIGVDYRLTRALSIGPSFEYTLLVPVAGCATRTATGYADAEYCTDSSDPTIKKSFVADATGAWTAGIDIRFTPF